MGKVSPLKKHLSYLRYLLRHRRYVFQECLKLGLELGIARGGLSLMWRGVVHDWSKFRPKEFFPYSDHFYGKRTGTQRDSTGYYKPTDTGDPCFDLAWLHHQNLNDHHWQYWVIPEDEEGYLVKDMAWLAIHEMVCDWRGAGRAQGTPDTLKWYDANREKLQLGRLTRSKVESLLNWKTLTGTRNGQ